MWTDICDIWVYDGDNTFEWVKDVHSFGRRLWSPSEGQGHVWASKSLRPRQENYAKFVRFQFLVVERWRRSCNVRQRCRQQLPLLYSRWTPPSWSEGCYQCHPLQQHSNTCNNISNNIYVYSPKRQNSNNIVNIRIDDIKYEIKQ